MSDSNKQLAAIAGVMAMLISEEPTLEYPQRPLENAPSVWQAYGRQQTMQYRDIIQRRIIKRSR